MKVTVVGSGTSQGIPIVACTCPGCTSDDPRDKRLRVSVFIETDPGSSGKPVKILIDTSPDFRQQMLTNKITDIDAVLFTHFHADHIMGLDDIRQINQIHNKAIDIYGNEDTINNIKRTFSYIFDPNTYRGGGVPDVITNIITLNKFSVKGIDITPIEYMHGPTVVYGFRIGNFAYMTDCSMIPDNEYGKLLGLKVLMLDALRYRKHATHFSFEEAIAASQKIGAEKTFFTHMTHDIVHAEAEAKLPDGIRLAYDGLTLVIPAKAGI